MEMNITTVYYFKTILLQCVICVAVINMGHSSREHTANVKSCQTPAHLQSEKIENDLWNMREDSTQLNPFEVQWYEERAALYNYYKLQHTHTYYSPIQNRINNIEIPTNKEKI